MTFKVSHFPKDVILMLSKSWYIAYPLSYRHVDELLAERGLRLTMQLLIVGLLSIHMLLNPNLETQRKWLIKVGGWMRLTLKAKGNGFTIIVPSIKRGK